MFKVTTSIKKILALKKRIKIIQGGSSAGKTFAIMTILINIALSKPNLRISVVSCTLPHLRRGAFADFISILKMTKRWFPNQLNKSTYKYTFKNGSYIEFFPADDSKKLRGSRRDILFVNEANLIQYESYNQLAMRTKGDIYLDYNPAREFWVEEIKQDKKSDFLILTYKDNEALDENTIEFLESKRKLNTNYWKNWCRVYLDGLTGRLDSVIFENYKVITEIPIEAKLLGYGLDFGFTNDPTAMVAIYQMNGKILIKELIYETKLTNRDIYNRINTLELDKSKIIVCDSSEPKSIQELKRLGLKTIGVKKGKDSIIYGIQLMQQYNLELIGPNLINEFNNYQYKMDRDGKNTGVPMDKDNHLIDAARYGIMELIGNTSKRATGKYKIRSIK